MEVSGSVEQDKSVSTIRGWLFKLCFVIGLLLGAGWAYEMYKKYGLQGAIYGAIGVAVYLIAAPLAWSIGNWFRKFVMPDSYLTFGTADSFKKKIFWLVGPQWTAFSMTTLVVFVVPAMLLDGKKQQSPPVVSQPQTTEIASTATPQETIAPAASAPTTTASSTEAKQEVSQSNGAASGEAVSSKQPTAQEKPEFSVNAPDQARSDLSNMLNNANNAIKLAELKGNLEQLPKPNAGDRKSARQLNDRGLAALKADNFSDATNLLQQAVAADPADIEVRNNYVYALLKAKNLDAAEKEVGVALMYSPGRSSAWANLAEIYADKGNVSASASALMVAFQFSSNKDKTLVFMNEKANSLENQKMSEAAKLALAKLKSN